MKQSEDCKSHKIVKNVHHNAGLNKIFTEGKYHLCDDRIIDKTSIGWVAEVVNDFRNDDSKHNAKKNAQEQTDGHPVRAHCKYKNKKTHNFISKVNPNLKYFPIQKNHCQIPFQITVVPAQSQLTSFNQTTSLCVHILPFHRSDGIASNMLSFWVAIFYHLLILGPFCVHACILQFFILSHLNNYTQNPLDVFLPTGIITLKIIYFSLDFSFKELY